MDADYKGHHIEAYAWLAPDGRWVCRLIISWSEVGQVLFKCPYIARTFATKEETEREGFLFAKKWIDDGKPDLQNMTREWAAQGFGSAALNLREMRQHTSKIETRGRVHARPQRPSRYSHTQPL